MIKKIDIEGAEQYLDIRAIAPNLVLIECLSHSLRTVGGFLVSAKMEQEDVKDLIIKSTCGGKITLSNPFVSKEALVRDLFQKKKILFCKKLGIK